MPPLEIIEGADLAPLSTFRLPARAERLITLDHPDQLPELSTEPGPRLMLGGGSNTLFMADWPGTVLLNRLRGIQLEPIDDRQARVRAGGGENWHALVRWCLDRGLYGIENLALIPGSVGAAPMQNIGAYGVELADVLESVRAWDWQTAQMVDISAADCGLAYRDSRFKSVDLGRFLITAVNLRLRRDFLPTLRYPSLAEHLKAHDVSAPSPRQLVAAVMRLRRHRLPDPARLANAGSFFKNPVLSARQARDLIVDHPKLAHWPLPDGRVKLAAAWMIEQLELKGYRVGDAGVYWNHALVLVNHGQAKAADLLALIAHVRQSVRDRFGLDLEIEPNLVGAD